LRWQRGIYRNDRAGGIMVNGNVVAIFMRPLPAAKWKKWK
jgi:hypothetical protein